MVYFLKLHVRNYVCVIRILTSSRQGVHFIPPPPFYLKNQPLKSLPRLGLNCTSFTEVSGAL